MRCCNLEKTFLQGNFSVMDTGMLITLLVSVFLLADALRE